MSQKIFDTIILLPCEGVTSGQIEEETHRVASSLGVIGRYIHNDKLYEVSLDSEFLCNVTANISTRK